jgi:DNA-binding NarL/FixJ family response regulator
LATALDAPFLAAAALHATGAVLLAGQDARAAHAALQQARERWTELDAPYETARTVVLMATACRELGDRYGASLALEAALHTFQQLGAAADVRLAQQLSASGDPAGTGRLTARELQVVRLLAAGRTNRAIADQLSISEKTVARHVSNIFNKLDLSSRAAATAWAYQHHVV